MLHRRDAMIRLGQLGLSSLTLPGLLGAEQQPASIPGRGPKAKSCIFLFLWGGPPQLDTWDLKPDSPAGFRSLFQPIRTAVPGIHLCDQMPLIARHTDKMAIIRSMSHPSVFHEVGTYHTLTGRTPTPTLIAPANFRRRSDFPYVGSVVSYFSPPAAMPASVTIPRPMSFEGSVWAGSYAGFLGPGHDPMEPRDVLASTGHTAHALTMPAGVDASRLIARRGLLQLVEDQDRILQKSPPADALTGFREQAHRMMTSRAARQAFDLDREPPALRDRYGRNEYGDSFLLARRLVEAGVRLVSVFWMYFIPDGRLLIPWDAHGGLEGLGRISGFEMLKAEYGIPPLDRAYSALLDDLHQRGLLDETLVVMTGEFGRTPRINRDQGREHWGACYSAVLAGGGVGGGQVYGASDKIAAYPQDNPVAPEDLLATVYQALGIPSESEITDHQGRPMKVCEGKAVEAIFG